MDTDVSGLSALGQKIFKILSEKRTDKNEFQVINKNQFDGETLDSFFAVLKELRSSGLVSFYQDYTYTPYVHFGDMTTKQYSKMDIRLKISDQ